MSRPGVRRLLILTSIASVIALPFGVIGLLYAAIVSEAPSVDRDALTVFYGLTWLLPATLLVCAVTGWVLFMLHRHSAAAFFALLPAIHFLGIGVALALALKDADWS